MSYIPQKLKTVTYRKHFVNWYISISWCGNVFHITDLLWGDPPVINRFSPKWPSLYWGVKYFEFAGDLKPHGTPVTSLLWNSITGVSIISSSKTRMINKLNDDKKNVEALSLLFEKWDMLRSRGVCSCNIIYVAFAGVPNIIHLNFSFIYTKLAALTSRRTMKCRYDIWLCVIWINDKANAIYQNYRSAKKLGKITVNMYSCNITTWHIESMENNDSLIISILSKFRNQCISTTYKQCIKNNQLF